MQSTAMALVQSLTKLAAVSAPAESDPYARGLAPQLPHRTSGTEWRPAFIEWPEWARSGRSYFDDAALRSPNRVAEPTNTESEHCRRKFILPFQALKPTIG